MRGMSSLTHTAQRILYTSSLEKRYPVSWPLPSGQVCADQHWLQIAAAAVGAQGIGLLPLCKLLDGLPPPVKGHIPVIAQAGQALLLQILVCCSAAVQCVAEHHHFVPSPLLPGHYLQCMVGLCPVYVTSRLDC